MSQNKIESDALSQLPVPRVGGDGEQETSASAAQAEAGQQVPEGYRFAPVHATPDMRAAGLKEGRRRDCDMDSSDAEMIYAAMLAASPAAPAVPAPQNPPQVLTLPTAIMGLTPDEKHDAFTAWVAGEREAYLLGHRDARYAAADLVLARADELAALAVPAPLQAEQDERASIDVDQLANFIRSIDGDHKMGAGALAEHIAGYVSGWVERSAALSAAAPALPVSAEPQQAVPGADLAQDAGFRAAAVLYRRAKASELPVAWAALVKAAGSAATPSVPSGEQESIDTPEFREHLSDLRYPWTDPENERQAETKFIAHVALQVQAGRDKALDLRNVATVTRASDQGLSLSFTSARAAGQFEREIAALRSPASTEQGDEHAD